MFDVGMPVIGDNFIGREQEIRELTRSIIDYCNISVYGLPRIGKTSLVKETIRRIAVNNPDSCPLFFEYTLTRNPENRTDFYSALCDFLEDIVLETGENALKLTKELDGKLRKTSSYLVYIRFYGELYEIIHRPLYIIIDEMDYAHESLGGEVQNLRELATQSPYIRLINISRHTLASIFPLGIDGSNYPGIFNPIIPLRGYIDEDVQLYRSRLHAYTDIVNDELWEKIQYYCGNIPVLLSDFASKIISKKDFYFDQDLESIISQNSHYRTCLHYWFQSLCERKLLRELLEFIEVGDKGIGDLSSYGIVVNQKIAVPYFEDYVISIIGNSNNYSELYQEYFSLENEIKQVIEKCTNLLKELMGLDKTTCREVQGVKTNMEAALLKINYTKSLSALKDANLIKPDISIEEVNMIKQYTYQYSGRLDCLNNSSF